MKRPDPTRNERQRQARWRKRRGKIAVWAYIDEDILEEGIYSGWWTPEEARDRHLVAKIIGQKLEIMLRE